jgi:uncharacterized metal-binding protein
MLYKHILIYHQGSTEKFVINMSHCSGSYGCRREEKVRVLYVCSGAADVGQIDLILSPANRMMKNGVA